MIDWILEKAGGEMKRLSATIVCALLISTVVLVGANDAQQVPAEREVVVEICTIDLTVPGQMSDIVSNALRRGLDRRESEVRGFLDGAEKRYSTGMKLLQAAAKHFSIKEDVLLAEVEKFKHCNCTHGDSAVDAAVDVVRTMVDVVADDGGGDAVGEMESENVGGGDTTGTKVSQFAMDVTTSVVLHELGHALIREFDLPVLGNEETVADAFATCYLTAHMPDRAYDILEARIKSWMVEASEVPRSEWQINGEHNNDARRAFQVAALAIAADFEKYHSLASEVGMTDGDIRKARDYGTEIHRSWRRILKPLWMPHGMASRETRMRYDRDDQIVSQLIASGMTAELESVLGQFDWHSQVTIHFAGGDGGAGWSRSKRTVTVHSEYVERFIKQETVAK